MKDSYNPRECGARLTEASREIQVILPG